MHVTRKVFLLGTVLGTFAAWPGMIHAQPAPEVSTCGTEPRPAACDAVRGDRAEGWTVQSRSEVMAQHGMVVTSQPLAAQAGLRILMQGGNAIDAAVATAAALNVTEPMNVGLAGDLFAIIYLAKDHSIHVLNASGKAPSGATVAHFNALGYAADPKNWGPGSGMPRFGILPVTVPGAAWGWDEVLRRHGTMQLGQVLQPAIDYAENGFPVSERIAHDWKLPTVVYAEDSPPAAEQVTHDPNMPRALPPQRCCTALDQDSVRTWYIDGKPPRPGQVFRNPDLARTLRLLGQGGRDAFYRGEIARAIVAKSQALGGTMTPEDLATYQGEWVEPVAMEYHGYQVLELPPPSQGLATEEALNILDACVPKLLQGRTLADLGPRSPEYWHLMVEAKKLAYADLYAHNADPDVVRVPVEQLLSKDHAASLCGRIDPQHASSTGPVGRGGGEGDTVVLSTADRWGNMVSWVNSNYATFGSGLTVPGYGFILHNRGALFSLDPESPNAIAPGKRPYNTLMAGFVMRGGMPLMTLGLMGGDMQAQGHQQALLDIIDLGANVQAAGDMARFYHNQITNVLQLEAPLYQLVGDPLAAMGHKVEPSGRAPMGGYQAIMFMPDGTQGQAAQPSDSDPRVGGVYRAGSDPGKDGQAVGW